MFSISLNGLLCNIVTSAIAFLHSHPVWGRMLWSSLAEFGKVFGLGGCCDFQAYLHGKKQVGKTSPFPPCFDLTLAPKLITCCYTVQQKNRKEKKVQYEKVSRQRNLILQTLFLLQSNKFQCSSGPWAGQMDCLHCCTIKVFTKNSLGPQWKDHISYCNRKTKQYIQYNFIKALSDVVCLFVCLQAFQ